jgi:YebC/PmpR family DNA-binding regulatory protein
MAGHSKWANIKHKKAKEDALRGKAFTKISKEITIAAKEGGDPAGNPRLRTLLEKAKHINMPGENIKRAIQKGTGELPGVHYEHHQYEGYGPGGMAVIVEVLTDNKNRAIADMRHIFLKKGGNVAADGAVSWMFSLQGVIKLSECKKSEDELFEILLDYDVTTVEKHEDMAIIHTHSKALMEVKEALEKNGIKLDHAEIEWVASNTVSLEGEEADKAVEFLDALEELDDIQNVYNNLA